jgi:hypothetical protein
MQSYRHIPGALTLLATLACSAGVRDPADRSQSANGVTEPAAAPLAPMAVTNPDPERAWTFMVYMNGDNDLEDWALKDFEEMASIADQSQVNIVVQLDRSPFYSSDLGDWTDTRRFRITQGMRAETKSAIPGFAGEVDMADGAELRRFVSWAMKQYPARRYALVIWSHAQGWRYQPMPVITRLVSSARQRVQTERTLRLPPEQSPPSALDLEEHPVRSVSHDETSGRVMYNREIQTQLEAELAGHGTLDVLGFDACLMGMLETGYALRNIAQVLVASEENIPLAGWNYRTILRDLVARPEMDASALGELIVSAYDGEYGLHGTHQDPETTLAATRLDQTGPVAIAASRLSDELRSAIMTPDRSKIIAARDACHSYARSKSNSMDIRCFTDRLAQSATRPALREAAKQVSASVEATVIRRYAHPQREMGYGSFGIAIYFPSRGAAFVQDPLSGAYRNGLPAARFPVQFVEDHRWDEFVRAYAAAVP